MPRKKKVEPESEEEEIQEHNQNENENEIQNENEQENNSLEEGETINTELGEYQNQDDNNNENKNNENKNENNNNNNNNNNEYQNQEDENDNQNPILKRAKTEKSEDDTNFGEENPEGSENKQTRVLFIRGIPFNTTEQDISLIVQPFGQVSDHLLLIKQQTAFIEMESEDAAQKVLNYFASLQPTLKGHPIQFLPSNRDKIEHKPKPDKAENPTEKQPRRVILITVSNKIYPIGIDVLQEVFQRCGTVHKIVTFTSKTGGFQAFIQYSNVSEAQEAMKTLDNQNIYSNCCTLSIQYSDLDDVNVKFNNEKTRDFTNPDLPTTAPPIQKEPRNFGGGNQNFRGGNQMHFSNRGGMQGYQGGNFHNQAYNPQGGTFHNQAYNPQGGNFQNQAFQNQAFQNQAFQNQAFQNQGYPLQATGFNQQYHNNQSTVLHVTHLNPQECNPDVLFTLFGVYGDVQRVKIMFNKQDNALIQMATNEQCINAIKYLSGLSLYGSNIHVTLSKNSYVSMPRISNAESEKFTKDYSNSPFHRYKGSGLKQYQHICAPSNSLHISNLAENTTEDQIKTVFSTYGAVIKVNLFTPNNTQVHMGVVEMGTQEQAVDALIKLHNTNLNNQLLRVTFSQPKKKKSIPHLNTVVPNPNLPNQSLPYSQTFNPYTQ